SAVGSNIVPVVVKSGGSGSMKSLKLFMELKNSQLAVKVSGFNFSFFEKVQTVPFYGIEALLKWAKK
ncbi:MAG: hypothetical protein GY757_17495, partial [bacterium]|nr:hypothetical protein [bacterium]